MAKKREKKKKVYIKAEDRGHICLYIYIYI